MILSFSRENVETRHFVEKIWGGLYIPRCEDPWNAPSIMDQCKIRGFFQEKTYYFPKIHTIRHDPRDRWKPGKLIHFTINNRTPESFRFAPITRVVSVQNIYIQNQSVFVRNSGIWSKFEQNELEELARNDGFNSLREFWDYFADGGGKYYTIIHWTDKKY